MLCLAKGHAAVRCGEREWGRAWALLIDDHAHRRWGPSVARIALLRAVRNADEQIHLRPQIIKVAWHAGRLPYLHRPVAVHLDVHERNEGIGNVSIIETPRTECHGEVAAAIRGVRDSVTDAIDLLAAHGPVRIAQRVGVVRDRHHPAAANGINHIAFYEFAPLVYQKRVSHVDRSAEILSIEANEIGPLLAFDVDEAQHLPLLHVKGGIAARRNDPFLDDRSGHRMLMQDVALRWHVIPPFLAFA